MPKSIRIVFLFDVNHSRAIFDLKSDVESRTASIRLSCLKLINYFIHRRLKNYTKVQWGYKFYSSNSCQKDLRSYRQSFIDFELEHFEEFEQTFNSCVEKYQQIEANEEKNRSHAQNLNIILRELLYDFDWDSPDISTPDKVRQISAHKRKKSAESELEKYVFIVSKCPWTRDDLYSFLGQQQIDSNVILSPILMSKAVLSSYTRTFQIKLFWLDIDDDNLLTPDDAFDGYDIMGNVLKDINGKIIPISSLFEASISFESVLDWYFNPDKKVKQFYSDLILDENAMVLKLELFTFQQTKIFEFFELMQSKSEFYPISVTGVSYKSLITPQNCLGCLARAESKEKYYHTLKTLMDKNLNLVININGCSGILYPVTPTLAMLCLMDITPQLFSLDRSVVVKRLDYPKSEKDLKKLDKKNTRNLEYISNYVNESPRFASIGSINEISEFEHPFTCKYLAKWFIPESVSLLPDLAVSEKQMMAEKREEELLARLAECFNEKEALSDRENESDVTTISPVHLPKISSNLKVSERSSELVIQSLKNLKAKNEKLRNDDENKRKLKKKPQRPSRNRQLSEALENFSLTDEEQLVNQLKDYYKHCVESKQSLLTCAENIINVVIHHMQMNSNENCDNIATRLLNNELFKTPSAITKAYENPDSNDRIREYELQSLLRMEAISAKIPRESDSDQFVEEVVTLLRMLSLYSSVCRLSTFLRETILVNYSDENPEAVITIFEELNQSLPPELDPHSSSDEEADGIQNYVLNTNMEADSKTTDSDYHSYNSASSSAKSSTLASNRKRKMSLPVKRLGGTLNRTIVITAKQNARLKLRVQSSDVELGNEKTKKKKASARRSLFDSTSITPVKRLSYDDVVFETPEEERGKKVRKSGNFIVRETPKHKIVARRLYSDSQPVMAIRRILSSPAKLSATQTSDFVVSSPVFKGQSSPEPLTFPSWSHLISASTSSAAPNSPEIDLWDRSGALINRSISEYESRNKDDDVFYADNEKCETPCNNFLNSPFDKWKRIKPRADSFSFTDCNKRKSESEFGTFEFAQPKKRAKSEVENGRLNFTSCDKTPTKNGSPKAQFTSPSSLSLLHIITSPVKNRTAYKNTSLNV